MIVIHFTLNFIPTKQLFLFDENTVERVERNYTWRTYDFEGIIHDDDYSQNTVQFENVVLVRILFHFTWEKQRYKNLVGKFKDTKSRDLTGA